jgi:hypothetical protein
MIPAAAGRVLIEKIEATIELSFYCLRQTIEITDVISNFIDLSNETSNSNLEP